jgi:hypothetical protein
MLAFRQDITESSVIDETVDKHFDTSIE